MKDNGFNLAWYGWMDSKLKIPVDSLPQNDSNFVINREFQRKLLSDQLGISEDEYNFIDENIRIPFDRKETKKVPVVAHIEFNFAPGYGAKNKLVILPDSINITGSLDSLAKISKVDTKKMTLTNIKEKKSGKIKLQKKSGQIKYFQNEVSFSQNVAKFTEGRFEVPINLINIPENWNIEIFPKTAVVIFTATLSDYKDISESDFRVVCDFQNGIDSDRDFLIPELVIYPKDILNERLNVNRVDFIISK
jgi:YbbR domain-containing protein